MIFHIPPQPLGVVSIQFGLESLRPSAPNFSLRSAGANAAAAQPKQQAADEYIYSAHIIPFSFISPSQPLTDTFARPI